MIRTPRLTVWSGKNQRVLREGTNILLGLLFPGDVVFNSCRKLDGIYLMALSDGLKELQGRE